MNRLPRWGLALIIAIHRVRLVTAATIMPAGVTNTRGQTLAISLLPCIYFGKQAVEQP